MRRIVLCSTMLAALASTAEWYDTWTDPTTGTKWHYSVQDNEVGVTASYVDFEDRRTRAEGLIIPSVIDGMPVTRINEGAFQDFNSITNIIIPSSVKNIGPHAFRLCLKLPAISIPQGVTNIGNGAFAFSGLKEIDLPNGLPIIRSELFSACGSLTSVTIPESVINIEGFAFPGVHHLNVLKSPMA